jgi:membrane protein
MDEPLKSRIQTLTELVRATYEAFTTDSCRAYSAALVYYSTLSVVPLLVMIFALPGMLLGLVSRQAAERLTATAGDIFGPPLAEMLTNALARVQNQSFVVAAVSLTMLIYSASSGFRFLRYAFRRIWSTERYDDAEPREARLGRTILGRAFDYLLSFGMVLAAPLIAMAGLLIYMLTLFARAVLNDLPFVGDALGSLLMPVMLLGIYAGIYIFQLWVLPPVRLNWREIWLPGLLCAGAVVITTYSLGFYVRFFSASNLYGAIGTIFALQFWAYANALAFFACAELCKLQVRERRRAAAPAASVQAG